MPARMTRLKADELLSKYGGAYNADISAYENVIDELSELFDVSRQAAKIRLSELGYIKAEELIRLLMGDMYMVIRLILVR